MNNVLIRAAGGAMSNEQGVGVYGATIRAAVLMGIGVGLVVGGLTDAETGMTVGAGAAVLALVGIGLAIGFFQARQG